MLFCTLQQCRIANDNYVKCVQTAMEKLQMMAIKIQHNARTKNQRWRITIIANFWQYSLIFRTLSITSRSATPLHLSNPMIISDGNRNKSRECNQILQKKNMSWIVRVSTRQCCVCIDIHSDAAPIIFSFLVTIKKNKKKWNVKKLNVMLPPRNMEPIFQANHGKPTSYWGPELMINNIHLLPLTQQVKWGREPQRPPSLLIVFIVMHSGSCPRFKWELPIFFKKRSHPLLLGQAEREWPKDRLRQLILPPTDYMSVSISSVHVIIRFHTWTLFR